MFRATDNLVKANVNVYRVFPGESVILSEDVP